MNAFLGFLWLVVIIGNGLAVVRQRRRSGEVRDRAHPIKDNLLLLGSAIVLASAMFAAIWWMGSKAPNLGSTSGPTLRGGCARDRGGNHRCSKLLRSRWARRANGK